MPNLRNTSAVKDGNTIRVQGSKGSSATIRAYVNPDLIAFPTNEALFDAFNQINTPKAQDSSTNESFDLLITVPPADSYSVKIVSSDGKAESPPVLHQLPQPIGPVTDPVE